MIQRDLIKEWCRVYGEIIPAKMSGRVFMGTMFGSETSKRCRELRGKGVLASERIGKFEVFRLESNNSPLEALEPLESQDFNKKEVSIGGLTLEEAKKAIEKQRQLNFLNKL